MPDQHAAATEHELITTITEPLGKLPEDPLSVVSVDFPIALRGYDRFAVDAYVEQTAQLVAELQATRSPEGAVRRALERVGEEISGILQRAHDTADEITARSRSEAEERLETARREARELTMAAESQVKDLDAETDRIWAERHSIVTDAQELARRLMELAESAMERFPAAPPAPEDMEMAEAVPTVDAGIEMHVESIEAHTPAQPFDGAAEGLDDPDPLLDEPDHLLVDDPGPLLEEDEPTVEQTTADHPAVELTTEDYPAAERPRAAHSTTDQPTVDMPPIEPWEGDPGPFHPGQA
ncbi:MAG: DivIVA domain-containing protein [Actinomycetota bacterium]|nr:DivIVA domain-containing protein [Actinomycetota bacterium]